MCMTLKTDTDKIINLLPPTIADQVRKGTDQQVVFHNNGSWELSFVLDGDFCCVEFDTDGKPFVQPICPSADLVEVN